MKHLLLACFGLLAWAHPAKAAYQPIAPVDTVLGEARITHLFTQGICTQLAIESRHQDLTILTREQGLGLMHDMITTVIMQNEAEMEAFGGRLSDMKAVMQRLTIQAVVDLGRVCPSSWKLFTQLGLSMASVDDSKLVPAQRQAVLAVAHAMCTELAAEEAIKPFSQRLASERLAVYWAASERQLRAHHAMLAAAFGTDVATSQSVKDQLWQYIDVRMFEECPVQTAQIRVDLGLERQAQSQAAPPRQEGTAPARSPGRKK